MDGQRFSLRLRRAGCVIALGLVAAACSPNDTVTQAELPATTAPPATVAAPTTTTTEPPPASVEFTTDQDSGRTPFSGAEDSEPRTRPTQTGSVTLDDDDPFENGQNVSGDIAVLRNQQRIQTVISAGQRLTVTFEAGTPDSENTLCTNDGSLEVIELDRQVQIEVTELQIFAPGAHSSDCPRATGAPWAVTTRLQEPIGDRVVVDQWTGREHRVVAEEARLVPTWLPEGWITLRDDELLPLRTARYVAPNGEILVFQVAPITAGYRLTDHREERGWEPTSVRNPDDGVFLSLDDRRTSVTFEEQGWYYKVNSTPGVDPSIVLEFARSFERPALAGELDPALTPREVSVPQPGQEEREARALQGVAIE